MSQQRLPLSHEMPEIDFATLDLLPYGIIVVDEHGTILYYNAREEQISGRARANVLGKNFFTEVAPCTQVEEFYGRFRETMRDVGFVANFRFRFPFPGRLHEVEISLTSFRKDKAHLCIISVKDVTEQEHLRQRMIQSERFREVGEAAAGVAHNFNNLLNVIRGSAELILMMDVQNDLLRRHAERILRASDDGVEIVQRIRQSTSLQTAPDAQRALARVQLNELIKDAIAFTEDYARAVEDERDVRVQFALELAADLLPVQGVAGELREVFTNLLRNAIDAISGDGHITVRTRAEGDYLIAQVSDNGTGMSREVQDRIFLPLFTTKGERGMGLGLASCYAIVQRHGGDIRAESTPGQGTTFTVRLPVGV